MEIYFFRHGGGIPCRKTSRRGFCVELPGSIFGFGGGREEGWWEIRPGEKNPPPSPTGESSTGKTDRITVSSLLSAVGGGG